MVVKPDWVDEVFRTGQPAVSGVRQDPETKNWFVTIGVPVVRGDQVIFALGVRVRSSAFSDLIRRQSPPQGGLITLLDSTPVIIARTRNEERFVGQPPTPEFARRSRAQPEGTWRTVTLEGVPAYSSWSRSSLTGWTIGNAMPSEAVDAPMRQSVRALLVTGLLTLATGLLLALLLTRGLVQSGRTVGTAARALARGEPLPAMRAPIAEAEDLSRALNDAADILAKRLRERDEAQAALSRAKDEFVATVSHELRTPLNAILGWVTLLQSGALPPARRAHALEVIERNTRAQTRLIEDLLDMSRMTRGSVRLDVTTLNLSPILESAIESVRPAAVAREIQVIAAPLPPAVPIAGDPSRLQQIFWNLLSNALKFTPAGGRVEVSLSTDDGQAVVRVTDTGEGIAPEFMPHVFDRYRQETDDVTRVHSGLGIGLSLVRELTALHGGTVTAESAGKNQGSTFTVRLPLCDETAAPGD
jgi:signal transduction histidine kinase